ncbi:RNA methyltransferase [Cyanobium sp. Cruz CV13-4-11]|uniref:RNA methyltransferase n=1 Tax=unclassified Cyanobium TaxID=2627006 RepID=UPI0020CBDBBC|nr:MULTISPECIES: RNA methyltransferase [unclassified Cyanobium]MCP9900672.1 RNA methyltransferase [Cyanobium sp. Cruz CV11-17]MCP9919823.1 RNA methyltransferase [Cyanobium sp. Cruz CV13-4-11]
MGLPDQLLLSDLLRRQVRCDQGLERGAGVLAWMHPPVHRLLGWASRPSAFAQKRLVWRLDQLRGLGEQEVFVKGEPAETDAVTLERLPTLIDAALSGADDVPLGLVADAAVELRSGRILHYLVARSDPRLPGTSRWRLSPDRIVDQQPGRVFTALRGLDDLPVARASVRQQLLRRSRRWKEQVQEVGGRVEERLEGWLEEPPWPEAFREEIPWPERDRDPERDPRDRYDGDPYPEQRYANDRDEPDPLEDWPEEEEPEAPLPEPPAPRRDRYRGREPHGDDDPWI